MSEHRHTDRAGYAGASFRTFDQIDREDIKRARHAAEALFAPKRPVIEPASLVPPHTANQVPRKPRVLSAIQVQPTSVEPAKPPVERDAPRSRQQIPTTHSARIRTWLKYGMTIQQAAEVYGVNVSEIEHILQRD